MGVNTVPVRVAFRAHGAMTESGLGFDLVVISIVKTSVGAGIIFLAF